MRCVLGVRGHGMIQIEEGLRNIGWHGNVDVTVRVSPVNVKAEVAGTAPIDSEGVFGCESGEKVICVGFGEIFDAEVVDGKSERGTT
jgi:hypothetical protein